VESRKTKRASALDPLGGAIARADILDAARAGRTELHITGAARQKENAPECLSSCLPNLMQWRKATQQKLTQDE